ncbi:hypothetical protein PHSY_000933 [Pseudozyma hubeiensis SY62]|uniref:Uncharacterized protein n=1 Tax=Pseudozyma hubeiensis (strain SY62) TaxID=1305764 RepID=R9NXG6_PSEHS|nr:hypothetical protein PHSY_000933 [Pseudozyma hubeiensis SY62]GAC93368.1 hypothetical protein PHSY_000933 [Pseudozyma hubeiensis SY62]
MLAIRGKDLFVEMTVGQVAWHGSAVPLVAGRAAEIQRNEGHSVVTQQRTAKRNKKSFGISTELNFRAISSACQTFDVRRDASSAGPFLAPLLTKARHCVSNCGIKTTITRTNLELIIAAMRDEVLAVLDKDCCR